MIARLYNTNDKENTMPTYQGYTNRATWAVHLHLSSDELYAAEARRISRKDNEFRFQNDDDLKEWVTWLIDAESDRMEPLARDLLIDAIASVDWREITESFREDD